MKLILSKAHEVVECVPIKQNRYKCIRCELIATLDEMFNGTRCRPHIELSTSGWIDESTEEERKYLDTLENI